MRGEGVMLVPGLLMAMDGCRDSSKEGLELRARDFWIFDSLYPGQRRVLWGLACSALGEQKEQNPWLLVSRGASQLWEGMDSSEWQLPWEPAGLGGSLEKYLQYTEGKELVQTLCSLWEGRSGIAVAVFSVFKRCCKD